MLDFSSSRLPLYLAIFLCAFLIVAESAVAVPILKSPGKWRDSGPAKVTSKVSIQVLGKYRDFTEAKRPNPRHALSTAQNRVDRALSARSAIVIDAVNERTLFAKNPNNPRQPASTIKVLTGMIALKSLQKTDPIPVSSKAARQPRSKVYLDQRKKYSAHDLINAVLLASANDASVALAEKIAGSESRFAQMMTLRAKLWGAKQTVCKTATGLTATGQQSTAHDLAIIFKHAMSDPEFAERMGHTKVRTKEGKLLRNHNKALWQVEGTEGGKTGYTNAARQTYVGKFKRGNDEIIVAIMGSERMWSDLKRLVEYGFQKKQLLAEMERDREMLVADRAK